LLADDLERGLGAVLRGPAALLPPRLEVPDFAAFASLIDVVFAIAFLQIS
jgi:hypothetical protein